MRQAPAPLRASTLRALDGARDPRRLLALAATILLAALAAPVGAQLDEHCIVSALNRTAPVDSEGVWVMPNTPANVGQVRLRATCVEDGVVRSGASELIAIPPDGIVEVAEIRFDLPAPVPERLTLGAGRSDLTALGQRLPLTATAFYPDGGRADVSVALAGTSYTTSNPAVATVEADGVVVARGAGVVLIGASNEGAGAFLRLTVTPSADSDGDGLPDDWERDNGLDPSDPSDAMLDHDDDGLSTLDEFLAGLDPFDPDTDGDGLLDGAEPVDPGTDPRRFDTDGDGFSDGLEETVGSDPLDPASFDLDAAIADLTVDPPAATIVFNTIDTEASRQLRAVARLIDGNDLDVTNAPFPTTFGSNDLTVASFGAVAGRVFAGQAGIATVTASVAGRSADATITVERFAPTALSFLPIPGSANGVRVEGDHAYVAAGGAGLVIADVRDLEAPFVVGLLDTPRNAIDLRLRDGSAYIADGEGGLVIVDVQDPAAPVSIGSLALGGKATDLALAGDHVFVATGDHLVIADVSIPTAPVLVASLPVAGAVGVDVDTASALAVVAAGLRGVTVVDITLLDTPRVVGTTHTRANNRSRASDVVVRGTRAYIADGYQSLGGVKVIDLSVPSTPVVIGASSNQFGVPDLAIERNRVLAADYFFPNAVPIFDVSLPQPSFSDVLDFRVPPLRRDDNGHGIDVRDGVVFLAATKNWRECIPWASGGLHIGRYARPTDLGSQAPEVTLTAPLPDTSALARTRLQLAAEAFDDFGVAGVRFEVDGQSVATVWQAPYTASVVVPETDALSLRAVAFDFAGRETVTEARTLAIFPNQLPTVSILAPAAGSPVVEGTTIPIAVRAEDDDQISLVEILVDGVLVASLTEAPFLHPYEVPIGPPSFTLQARTVDSVGQSAETAVATVPVDLAPSSQVAIIRPSAGVAVAGGRAFQVSVATDFLVDVARIELLVDDVAVASIDHRDTARFDIEAPIGSGELRLRAIAEDVAGRQAGSGELLVSVVDVAPRVYLESPAPGSLLVAGSPITVGAQVTDDGTVEEVLFLVEGEEIGRRTAPPWRVDTVVPDGLDFVTFDAVAIDDDGLSDGDSRTLPVSPNAPPTVALTFPAPGSSLAAGSSVTLNATATDDGTVAQVVFTIDGAARPAILSPPYVLGFEVPTDVDSLAIEVTATDDGGLSASDGGVFPVLPDEPPSVVLSSPPDGTQLVAGGVLSVLADATDDVRIEEVEIRVLDYFGPGDDLVDISISPVGPYALDTSVPAELDSLTVEVTATDTADQSTTVARTFDVVPAAATEVVGQVTDDVGTPIAGAAVMLDGALGAAFSSADGSFTLTGIASDMGDLQAIVTSDGGGSVLAGLSPVVPPVPDSTTDLGTIVLTPRAAHTYFDLCFDPTSTESLPFAAVACQGVVADADPDPDPDPGGGEGRGEGGGEPGECPCGPDILAVTVTPEVNDVLFTIDLPRAPLFPDALWAYLAIDTDQDPATGTTSQIERLSRHAPTGLGVELEIALGFGTVSPEIPFFFLGESLNFRVPKALLGDDLAFDFAVQLYDFSGDQGGPVKSFDDDTVASLLSDVAPNGGAYRFPPATSDLDTDGLSDSQEIAAGVSEPLVADTDADQRLDGFEVAMGADPAVFDGLFEDTEGDGLFDLLEQYFNGDPLDEDTDGDLLFDGGELEALTLPARPDTDGDGLPDGAEGGGEFGLSNPADRDSDNDGLDDGAELAAGTQARVPDSDAGGGAAGDGGATDGQEVLIDATDPVLGNDDRLPFAVGLSAPGANPETPQIAVGTNGQIHLVWLEEDGADRVYYALADADGTVRIAATRIGANTLLRQPRLAVDATGKAHVVWYGRPNNGRLEVVHTLLDPALDDQDGSPANDAVIAVRPDQQLSAPDAIHSLDPRIAVDTQNRAHVVWVDLFGGEQLRYSRIDDTGGVEIGDQLLLASLDNVADDLSIASDANDDLHLVFAENGSGFDMRTLFYALVDGTSGSLAIGKTRLLPFGDGVSMEAPSIDVGPDGTAFVTFLIRSDGCGDIQGLDLDPSADDRDGSPANPNDLITERSVLLSCLLEPAHFHPAMRIGPDGRRWVAFYDESISSTNTLFIAAWEADGSVRLPPMPASLPDTVDIDFGSSPPVIAPLGPEVFLGWVDRGSQSLRVRELLHDSDDDGIPDVEEP